MFVLDAHYDTNSRFLPTRRAASTIPCVPRCLLHRSGVNVSGKRTIRRHCPCEKVFEHHERQVSSTLRQVPFHYRGIYPGSVLDSFGRMPDAGRQLLRQASVSTSVHQDGRCSPWDGDKVDRDVHAGEQAAPGDVLSFV